MPIRNCEPGCTEHYACELRAKNVGVAPSSMPSRFNHGKLRPIVQPSWEKGIATEKRPGGYEMPYLNENGTRLRVKEAGERRHEIAAIRDRQRNAPSPFTKE